jgi:hypothetical protein
MVQLGDKIPLNLISHYIIKCYGLPLEYFLSGHWMFLSSSR